MYEGGGTWNPVRKKDRQTRSRYPNELKTRLTCGRLSYLFKKYGQTKMRSEDDLNREMTRRMPLNHPYDETV